jgi:hypothetical protein|tara:strand:- start:1208 stop:1588 length:381 start_codon:yes stop_codon:yes gene_type:complete
MAVNKHQRIIAFDLDDVICHRDIEGPTIEKYYSCVPNNSMIKVVNDCFDRGHRIIIYTARGMNVFKGDVATIMEKLYPLTLEQLHTWNVKFHELVMGKIHYDILIDDKALRSDRVSDIGDVEEYIK